MAAGRTPDPLQNCDPESAIFIAQRILDRIVFIAFCEDRDLLKERTIDAVYNTVPPFARAVNPRWQNFLGLFRAMDRGHENLPYLDGGFNGGLFKEDPRSTTSNSTTNGPNFSSESANTTSATRSTSRSWATCSRNRSPSWKNVACGGFFGLVQEDETPNAMRKSAERKRFGIYYTPPEFTRLIVRKRSSRGRRAIARLLAAHGLSGICSERTTPSPRWPPIGATAWPACGISRFSTRPAAAGRS